MLSVLDPIKFCLYHFTVFLNFFFRSSSSGGSKVSEISSFELDDISHGNSLDGQAAIDVGALDLKGVGVLLNSVSRCFLNDRVVPECHPSRYQVRAATCHIYVIYIYR